MSLYFSSLNAGSNRNCYYIGNDHDAVLIDAGISCRETERRMARLGLSIDRVNAIFKNHRAPFLKLLVLSHLSAQNNHPQVMHDLFTPYANGTCIVIASRFEETELFSIP
jgi:phosphoribosyl 1,2-cyclic phosphodiesterase